MQNKDAKYTFVTDLGKNTIKYTICTNIKLLTWKKWKSIDIKNIIKAQI